jgi:hypothetical protein
MIPGCRAIRILLAVFFCYCAFCAAAQPTLPDITGAADKGVIVLSWNCQYSGIRSISVLRSADGLSNYSVIGYVKNVEKGLQVFVDGHPAAGKNCYKLGIVFKSGLKWASNSYCRNIEQTALATSVRLPSNDSLQKMIVTQDVPTPEKPIATSSSPLPTNPSGYTTTAPVTDLESAKKHTNNTATPAPGISVSFGNDSIRRDAPPIGQSGIPALPRKKIIISFQEPDETAYTLVRSRYIYTDPATGHIIIDLPDDVATHHYSVKFYDSKNEMITEIPRINTSKIIVDKRNFQRKGIYKFKLRRDAVELETGYVMVD